MQVAINVEFTDEELRKYAEDVGRRWVHVLLSHLKDPDLSRFAQQAFAMGMNIAAAQEHKKRGAAPSPPPFGFHQAPFPFDFDFPGSVPRYPPPPSGAIKDPPPSILEKCFRIEKSAQYEEGWCCHKCGYANVEQRAVCRNCAHERCDDVVGDIPPGPIPA
jgi:hypothetical protein